MPAITPLVPDQQPAAVPAGSGTAALRILRQRADSGQLTHVERLPGRPGQPVPWPGWVPSAGGRGVPAGRRAAAVAAPGRRRRARQVRAQRDHRHRHRVRQVARLPAARADRGAGGRHRPVHLADQGPGRRPAAAGAVAGHTWRAGRGGGRRHPGRRAVLGPGPCRLPAHHAGHAAPHPAAAARPLGRLLPAAAVRDRRRVPRIPGRVRLARGARAAPAAAGRRASRRQRRRRPGLPAGLGHDQRAGPLCPAAHRARRRGGHRGRRAARPDDLLPVGAAADRAARRGGRAGPPDRHRGGRRRCSPTWCWRTCPRWRSSGPGAAPRRWRWPPGGTSPTRTPAAWPRGWPPTGPVTWPRTGGRWRRRCGRARSPGWPPRRRWSSASTSPAWTRC